MKIITAFDSFKGCMSAQDASHAAADGYRDRDPQAEIVCLPLSDGGEGMVACIAEALDVKMITVSVHDPLMHLIDAQYAIATNHDDQRTAFMEMAAASGLTLVPPALRNPEVTTTYGVGEMILDAISRHCTKIVMGIGGSATCDGGRGMIEALQGHLPLQADIVVASDVSNPLFGADGAAYVFAPQKGATPEQVVRLDQRLRDFAHETERLGIASPDLAFHPGAGAAGGLGYGLMAYLGATLTSGIDLLLDCIGFDQQIADADLILTGEGKTDSQTLYEQTAETHLPGQQKQSDTQPKKVPMGVLKRAQKQGKKVILLSGAIEDKETLLNAGFYDVRSINEHDTRHLALLMQRDIAMENLRKTVCNLE